MPQRKLLLARFCVAMAGMFVSIAYAACRLPVADGGERWPSPPSLIGTIIEVGPTGATLKTLKNRTWQIKAPASGKYFTAFGGDEKFEALQVGLAARVWLKGCRAAKGRVPAEAAYFEVYSSDPLDRPPPEYWRPW